MIKRTAGFLLILLLTGCSLLPTSVPTTIPLPTQEPFETATQACPGVCIPSQVPTSVELPIRTGTVGPVTETPVLTETFEVQTPTPEAPAATATETEPALPTGMVELTSTPTPYLSPTPGPSPTKTKIVSDKLYVLQDGTPRYMQNFTQAAAGCNWMGVAGQAFGAGGAPMKNLVVVISGELNGEQVDAVGLTGLATAYGEGGFEIQVANKAVASKGALTIQLFDLAGAELSDPYPFDTTADCAGNLAIINFVPNS
jgi:hypothetical protein